ncbi:hypothetical protein Glove_426g9 [Diversispora epigaea]|uniref:Uncharacterized protein n=1 Tax=Diversispora epigaea TaxID=1348612 RepID=A0A397GW54_9GLOM|nr:hypothetical protein Glove_426g9 [Diversispora epigaea]
MGNTKFKLDLLKQENSRLLVENTELRNENAKLRQDLEGYEARITKLEQGEKSITNVLQSSVCEAGYSVSNIISSEMENSNDTPISDITDNASNSNDVHEQIVIQNEDAEASDNVSNSGVSLSSIDIYQPICTEPKSSEDKEMDDFHDSIYKERVSKEIMERIREKKLREQNLSLNNSHSVTASGNLLEQPTLSFDIKTVNNVNDQDSKLLHSTETINNISQEQKSITNSTENLTLVSDFVQGLLQEFTSHNNQCWKSVEIPNPTSVSESLQKLAHLFHKASIVRKNLINTKREEILSWGRYSERYENKAIELKSENKNLTDKSARNRIYNEMKPYLSSISDRYLRVMTCKVRKINKLFGYEYDLVTLKKINGIGWHIVNRVTCSADSISKLTNPQIQYIIDYVTSKTVNNVNNQESKSTETEEAITSKSLPETEISTSPEFQPNPTHDCDYFRNKILLRYSDLYKTCSNKKFDYYDIIEGSLYPICKQSHEDGKSRVRNHLNI